MFIELVLTTQSYRNASELPLAASVGKKKFFDVGPVAIPKFKIARFGHVPGAKSWKIKKNQGNLKKTLENIMFFNDFGGIWELRASVHGI